MSDVQGAVDAGAEGAGAADTGNVAAQPDDPVGGGGEFALDDEIMTNDFDEVEVKAASEDQAAEPAKPAVDAKVAAAAPQGAPTQQPEQKPQVGSVQPPSAPVPQAPGASAAARPLSELQPGELVSELARNRDALVNHLAQERFQLSQAEKEALETDAVGHLPRLMARVYYEASTTMLNQIQSMVPRMIEQVTTQLRNHSDAENAFYSKWPTVDRANEAHKQAVLMAANLVNQQFPQASLSDRIDKVGRMVTSMLGLAAQVQQPRGNASAKRSPPAFAPASGNGATPVSRTPVAASQGNQWAGLGANFDE